MFFSKLIVYGAIAGSMFAASTFTTIGIQKAFNKSPVSDASTSDTYYEEEEEDFDYDLPEQEVSHQSQFVTNLTTFGNLEADVNVDILYQDYKFSIDGYVFVSLETLINPEIYADLTIHAFDKDIDVEATYKSNTIYLSLGDSKMMLNVKDIKSLTDSFSSLSVDTASMLPSSFANIDAIELLNRLSQMTFEDKGEYYAYSCKLFDDIPAFNFRSDKNHDLTGLNIEHASLFGFDISLDSDVRVLGSGHNKVEVPENAEEYFDIKEYIPAIEQIINIVSNKQVAVNYEIVGRDNDKQFITTSGKAVLDLNNNTEVLLDGNINLDIMGININSGYTIGFDNGNAYFNILDTLKGYVTNEDISNLISNVSTLLNNEKISALTASVSNVSLPVIDLINNGDIASIISSIKELKVDGEGINVKLSNDLLSENDSLIELSTKNTENGLSNILIKNIAYNNYSFDIALGLEEYKGVNHPNYSSYARLDKYLNVLKQVNAILSEEKIGLDMNVNLKKNDASLVALNGNLNLDLNNKSGNGAFHVVSDNDIYPINSDISISFDEDKAGLVIGEGKYCLSYSDIPSLMDKVETLLNILNVDLSSLSLDKVSLPVLTMVNNNEYSSIIDKVSLTSFTDDSLIINVSKDLLFEDSNGYFTIEITLDDNGIDSLIVTGLSYKDYIIDAELSLKEYKHVDVDYSEYRELKEYFSLFDQIHEILTNKEMGMSLDLDLNGVGINGDVNIKITDSDFLMNGEATISLGENDYLINIEKDNDGYYLTYKDGKVMINKDAVNTIIEEVVNFIKDEESIAYEYIPASLDMNEMLEKVSISSLAFDGDNLSIGLSIDDKALSLELALANGRISNVSFIYDVYQGQIALNSYSSKEEINKDDYTDASSISNAVKYVTSLDKSKQQAVIDQIKSFTNIDNLSLGSDYEITVSRDGTKIIVVTGDIDLSKLNENLALALSGEVDAKNTGMKSNFAVNYVDNTIYFNYDDIKLSYEQASLNSLINVIKTKIPSNVAIEDVLDKVLPSTSTLSAPIFELINSGEYQSLIQYYKDCYSKDGNLYLVLDASLLGDIDGELIFSMNINENGINNITLKNVSAFGYVLDFSFTLRDFDSHSIEIDNSGYISLNATDTLLTSILDLIEQKQYALKLNGSLGIKDKTFNFNGSTQFSIGDTVDHGIGKLAITTGTSSQKHNIIIDVNRNKYDSTASTEEKENALRNSRVLFSYNNNLKGTFNLFSLSQTFDVLMDFMDDNPRFDKYMALLTNDYSTSIISQVLNGHPEAILEQKLINNVSKVDNNYIITINGNFLKKNANIDLNDPSYNVSDIVLTIKCDNENNFSGIAINGELMDFNLNLSLDLDEYDATGYTGLEADYNANKNKYFDFSDMGTLVEYLLNTAMKNDFHIQGNLDINMKILKIFDKKIDPIPMEAWVHIEKDENDKEKVYSRIELSVPYLGSLVHNSDEWDERKFYIFFTDDEVYLRTETTYSEGKTSKTCYAVNTKSVLGVPWYKWQKNTTTWTHYDYQYQDVKMSMSEFFNNALYYLFTFGFDITDSVNLNDFASSSHEIDLSKLLTSYSYNSNNPSWNLKVSMNELTGKDIFEDLTVRLDGDNETKGMSGLYVNTALDVTVFGANVTLNASLTHDATPASLLTNIKGYLASNASNTNREIINSSSSIDGTKTVNDDGISVWLATVPIGYTRID